MFQEDCVACSQVPQELEMNLSDKLQDIISTLTDSLAYQVSIAMTSVTKVKYLLSHYHIQHINIGKRGWAINSLLTEKKGGV